MPQPDSPDPYDLVPYPGGPHYQTHPAAFGAIAMLYGLSPARAGWRVLELGCGSGDNLVPMAYAARDGKFTGIDLAAAPVARGRALIERLALDNVRLLQMDVMDFPADAGEFDYIIAHGLYSWVPHAARERILEICGRHLAAQGVAYVSYNAHPGGHLRMMLREMMLHYIQAETDTDTRIARAQRLLDAMSEIDPHDESDRFRQVARAEAQRLRRLGTAMLFHDELAPVNEPCYFRDFIAAAARHGMQFLAEAELASMNDDFVPAPMRAVLDEVGDDVLEREQLRDFLKCRRFRQTLLVRGGLRRAPDPVPDAMSSMHVASPARTDAQPPELVVDGDTIFFSRKDAKFTLNHAPTKLALAALGASYPAALPVSELMDRAFAALGWHGDDGRSKAAAAVVRRFLVWGSYSGIVETYLTAPAIAAEAGLRPRASAFARLQAEQNPLVTNLMHRPVRIEDPLTRRLIGLLDGSRDRPALLAALRDYVEGGNVPPATLQAFLGENRDASEESLERTLRGVAGLALLEA